MYACKHNQYLQIEVQTATAAGPVRLDFVIGIINGTQFTGNWGSSHHKMKCTPLNLALAFVMQKRGGEYFS